MEAAMNCSCHPELNTLSSKAMDNHTPHQVKYAVSVIYHAILCPFVTLITR